MLLLIPLGLIVMLLLSDDADIILKPTEEQDDE